jgi:MFS family permease
MTTDLPGAFHPSTKLYRFTILIFISLLVLGSYFAYDSIGALETTLMAELHLDRSTIGNLYTAYSVAAVAIVFFGGMLYDRLGPRKASLLFSILVFIGAVIVWPWPRASGCSSLDASSSGLAPSRSSWSRAPSSAVGSRARRWPWPLASP